MFTLPLHRGSSRLKVKTTSRNGNASSGDSSNVESWSGAIESLTNLGT